MSTPELCNALLVLATKLRHKGITFVCAEDLMLLTNLSSGVKDGTCSTKHYWKKLINHFGNGVKYMYTCVHCGTFVGEILKEERKVFQCPHCSAFNNRDASIRKGCMFAQCSLTDQLKHLYEHELKDDDFNDHVRKPGIISDVNDGNFYRENMEPGMISINLNCDGVPIFNSSGYEIYPLLATLNDLKPKRRRRHMMLCALWCGKGGSSLDMDVFLKPFVDESIRLYHDGFSYTKNGEVFNKRVLVVAVVGDSPVRAKLQNCVSATGYFGCMACLHPGIEVPKGKGTTHVYPFEYYEKRTHDETIEHATTQSFGLKGPPPLLGVPKHDVIRSIRPDSMHTVLLCVVRTKAKLWFKPKKKMKDEPKDPFDFSDKLKDVDRLLSKITPSLDVSRIPRPMSDRKFWKAHEWLLWLLFYSLPIISELFPSRYVRHWALLVSAASILYSSSIKKSDVYKAQELLNAFVEGMCDESLYGVKYVVNSVHLLLHLPDSVLDLGNLWSHSSFIYEDFNAVLQDSVKSSNGVVMQVVDHLRLKQTVCRLSGLVRKKMNKMQQEYLDKLTQRDKESDSHLQVDSVKLLGAGCVRVLKNEEFLALMRISAKYQRKSDVVCYERAMIGREIVHSASYTRVEKRKSFFVLVESANVVFEIMSFLLLPDCCCYALGYAHAILGDFIVRDVNVPHLKRLKPRESDLSAIRVKNIVEKVIVLEDIYRINVACIHPNHIEIGRTS